MREPAMIIAGSLFILLMKWLPSEIVGSVSSAPDVVVERDERVNERIEWNEDVCSVGAWDCASLVVNE